MGLLLLFETELTVSDRIGQLTLTAFGSQHKKE